MYNYKTKEERYVVLRFVRGICSGAGVLGWQTRSVLPRFHQRPEENNFMAYMRYLLLMAWW